MILLTGATGLVGSALLRRLTVAGRPVRCLVREPRRLGAERVRVQIALGDLTDPPSFRNAMRGVDTVIHLAASTRDQPRGSIEELNGIATWRMVQAAERAGVGRFLFLSSLGASRLSRSRFLRSKALAEAAVAEAGVATTVFAPSLVYAPGALWLRRLERLALLPAVPLPGAGSAALQPIWAEDVADCIASTLDRPVAGGGAAADRYELAGPETLSLEAVAALVLRSAGRRRLIARVPEPLARGALRGLELAVGPAAIATWDEAELMAVSRTARSGTADAERLGVRPERMPAVLGAA
jgi:NADH dehydrogenase